MNVEFELLDELRKKTTDFIYPLSLEGVIVEPAFNELLSFTDNMTRVMKYEKFLPKNILKELSLTINAMKSSSNKLNDKKLCEMIFKMEKISILLLWERQ
ncbi:hypothetical protein [Klebsiella aerogenes]|uniref:hypothetical protein n=1 Tax=Klebsiella aerogenes TaxID=548 RepID=UPI003984218F